jgi:hypothetical protein
MTVPQRPTPGQPSGASYWSEKLAGRPPALELPGATARAAATPAAPAKLAVRCAAALSRAYKDFLRAERVTFFDGWLALWAALLHRTTGQSDLLLGLREKGCDAALRFSFDDRPTFREHLARTVRELESARAHALERAELLRVAKATRIDALFQVMFTDERLTAASARGFDLALQAARNPRGAFTATLFHDARNAAVAIARMAGHVEVLLAAALERPTRRSRSSRCSRPTSASASSSAGTTPRRSSRASAACTSSSKRTWPALRTPPRSRSTGVSSPTRRWTRGPIGSRITSAASEWGRTSRRDRRRALIRDGHRPDGDRQGGRRLRADGSVVSARAARLPARGLARARAPDAGAPARALARAES